MKVVHGLSVPIGKLGSRLPRTLSTAITSRSISVDPEEPEPPFQIRDRIRNKTLILHQKDQSKDEQRAREEPLRPIFRIGGSVIQATPRDVETSELSSPNQHGTLIATAT